MIDKSFKHLLVAWQSSMILKAVRATPRASGYLILAMFVAAVIFVLAAHLLRLIAGPVPSADQTILIEKNCLRLDGACMHDWVTFQIYTRYDADIGRQIDITDTTFNQNISTAILIHGFADSSRSYLLVDMKYELLRKSDMQVILMDWSKLVRGGCYPSAAYNVRFAGRCLSDLITSMKRPSSGLHVIGFSLGGHVAASAADFLAPYKIPRITGLDPALPYFYGIGSHRRLGKNDGIFVDVIHTNSFIQGHFLPLGHVDFFVNGGTIQPGCDSNLIGKIQCSHARAAIYFSESINSKVGFWGCNTSYWYRFLGSCEPENIKWLMGYHVDNNLRGIVTLKTASTQPFALGKP